MFVAGMLPGYAEPAGSVARIAHLRAHDDVIGFLDIMDEMVDFQVLLAYGAMPLEHIVMDPVEEWLPEVLADKDDRNRLDLFRLNEDEEFGKLVQRAETARKKDIGLRGIGEHDLARKEIVEGDGLLDIRIDALFHGELYIQANGTRTSFLCAAIPCFHDARTSPGDDGISRFAEHFAKLASLNVMVLVIREACGSEKRNGVFESAQKLKALDEFRHDAENAPAEFIRHALGTHELRNRRMLLLRFS